MAEYIELSYWDLALASIFILLNGALSIAFRLGLAKKLFIVTIRMIVQLSIVAFLLKAIFAISSPFLTLIVALIMGLFAGREIWARQNKKLAGIWGYSIGAGSMMFAGFLVIIIALKTQIQPDPWWNPQFSLPLFGMILGNIMTGISLALDNLTTTLIREKRAIEALLLLGKNRQQALLPFVQGALRAGFMPIINAMAAMGIISLPGMMSGQILSGIDPVEAVKYQILILLLIGGATGLGVISATIFTALRLSDERDRLRLDRVK